MTERLGGIELRDWQREALERWHTCRCRGVVEAVTGTGKTMLGLAAAVDALRRGRNVLVVVPSTDLVEQWYGSVRRAIHGAQAGRRGGGHNDELGDVDILITTAQSAVSARFTIPDRPLLLIADEAHRYGADGFSRILTEDFGERLGLTATFERNDDGVDKYLEPYFGEVIDGCGYDRARADGIIAPIRVLTVGVSFTPYERGQYQELDDTCREQRGRLIQLYECRDEPFGAFMADVEELANDDSAHYDARKAAWDYLKAFTGRKALLASAAGKISTLRELGDVLDAASAGPRAPRSLVFSETKESAEAASAALTESGVTAAAYTSDLGKRDRREVLGEFKQGRMQALAAPKVLDEGVDLPAADVGIIAAASASRRQMIQRMGRIIRPKDDGRHATFIVLYIEGSSEDPAGGAHAAFLDQLVDVADQCIDVSARRAPGHLAYWLGIRDAPPRNRGSSATGGGARMQRTEPVAAASIDRGRDDPNETAARQSGLTALHLLRDGVGTDEADGVFARMALLPPDQIRVLLLRFGLTGMDPMSLQRTANRLGMDEPDVGALENAALVRLGV